MIRFVRPLVQASWINNDNNTKHRKERLRRQHSEMTTCDKMSRTTSFPKLRYFGRRQLYNGEMAEIISGSLRGIGQNSLH